MDKTTMPPRPSFGRATLALAMLCGAPAAAVADTPILYVCSDGASRKEFTNTFRPGCRALDDPGALPPPSSKAAPLTAAPGNSPAEFPRIDRAQQKARDNDRRAILAEELRNEKAKVAQLRAEFKGGQPDRHSDERSVGKYQERVKLIADNLGRAEKNVEALRREIANVR